MIRSELVARIAAQNPHLYGRDVEKVVSVILDKIAEGLAAGERVELRNFGTFAIRQQRAREGRNPRTGVVVDIAAKVSIQFREGRGMRARLNRAPEDLAEVPRHRRAS